MELDGVRRRRWRQGGRAAAVLVIVGVLGVGAASLIDPPARLGIADQPPASAPAPTDGEDGTSAPTDEPVITQPPALTVSSREPFAWSVAVSAGDGGRWCVTAARGTTEVTDQVGQPCDRQLRPERGVSWDMSARDGPEGQRLAWGLARPAADDVVVEFTDGTRRNARLSSGDAVDPTLWAIGYEQREVHAVEAQGENFAGGAVALDGFDVADMLLVLAGLAGILAVAAAARRRYRVGPLTSDSRAPI